MAVYFKSLPLFLAIVCLQYWSVNAEEKKEDDYKTTWKVTKKAEKCDVKSKLYDKLTVHYVGRITETDEIFDNSHERKDPFEFTLGYSEVIQGWDVGLMDMCVGETRTLVIPAAEAYGKEGAGDGKIKADMDLTYDVELLKIEAGEAPPDVFGMIDKDDNRKLDKTEVYNYLKMKSQETGSEDNEFDHQHDYIVKQIFESEDLDLDGFITHKEFSGPKRHDEL